MALTLAAFGAIIPNCSAAQETKAGTLVTNVASAKVRGGEGEWTVASNPVALLVAERLDVSLVRRDPSAPVVIVSPSTPVALTLVNRGNGREAFEVSATLSDASARVRLIAIDTDGDGRFDPAVDTVLIDDRTTGIEPGASLPLLVVVEPAGPTVTAAALDVAVRATTGSGPAGTTFAQRGDDGGDAVTGRTGAHADVVVPLGSAPGGVPVLVKAQSVRAPDGSANPVRGAVITYRLQARFGGPTEAARIADPIPPGTAYVPGSLMLDDAPLSDAAGDDAGSADAAGIAVTLGDIAAAQTRTIQFQVTIQ